MHRSPGCRAQEEGQSPPRFVPSPIHGLWEFKLVLNALLYFAISALPTETQSLRLLTFPSLNRSFCNQSQKNQQKKAQEGRNQDVKFYDGDVQPLVFSPILWVVVECSWRGVGGEGKEDREGK